MKTAFFVILLVLSLFWSLQTSKTIETISYTERMGGIVPVQKSRFEWHPERFLPFIKKLPEKAHLSFKGGIGRYKRQRAVSPDRSAVSPAKNFAPIRLKNGPEILGRIVEEQDGLVWVEMEGGRIAFKKEEIVSSKP